ncbi:GNAT family N-acetyltransferase [Paractinoplanes lichenicola]|uniref:GNAT family N-acetyltransferase n=1 Tax=Paractinoplanes lichenicola TaxID=2802976 RepID=A0ABS1VW75_9ACTN|nr:GNAT family N-acetyltransferase [Actinoplanes lichenicola]MBL7258688.1 GNAT family N-acetyltransferase [Actinoplanes lichenicola]
MRDLIERWQRGWAVARSLDPAEDVGDGLRTECHQPGRAVEYLALDVAALPALCAQVKGEEQVTWLTVPAADPDAAAETIEANGLVLLKRSERLMTINLHKHPTSEPPAPYQLETWLSDDVIRVEVLLDNEVGAHGTVGLTNADAVADRIETLPEHRRRGLASAVMSGLAGAAVDEGADHGLLIASEQGQHLYTALGWRPVASILIATTPGNTYPTD